MGVDSQIVGNGRTAHAIEHGGVAYEFRLLDQDAKAEWEKRFYQRAVAAAEALATVRGEQWLEEKLVALNEEFLGGDFSLFSDASRKLLGKPAGAPLLLSILSGREAEGLLPLLLAKPVEVKALLRLIFKESFPNVPLKDEGEPEKTSYPLCSRGEDSSGSGAAVNSSASAGSLQDHARRIRTAHRSADLRAVPARPQVGWRYRSFSTTFASASNRGSGRGRCSGGSTG